jgi:Holliday junction resolvase-like predicted endonuclease
MSVQDVLDNANMTREQAVELFAAASGGSSEEAAIYFLNANWEVELKDGTAESHADEIWESHELWKVMVEEQKEDGHDLNEVTARSFLEKSGTPMTALQFRSSFKELDITGDKRMSFLEFLQFKYADASTESIVALVKRPQATSPEMEKAKQAVIEVEAEKQAVADERAKLVELAAGTGVKAKAAVQQLAAFDQKDQVALKMAESKAERALAKAQKALAKEDGPKGALWWVEKGQAEAAKYKPKKK